MKLLAPISLLTTTAALAIETRQTTTPDRVYVTVTNLQCQPRGTTCFYTFQVRTTPSSAPLVCSATTQSATTLASVPDEPCSADPNTTFSFLQPGNGKPTALSFTWSAPWDRGVQKTNAFHVFAATDFARDQTGTQRYVGPAEFVVEGVTSSLVVRQ